MKRLLAVIFILALIPLPAASQVPSPEIEWNADWVVDQNVAIMELDSDTYQFELILEFWIDNKRITPIEVDITTEFEEVDFEIDNPGPVSVDANSNETFELKIMGSGHIDGGWALYNADEFSETITLTLAEIVAGTGLRPFDQNGQPLFAQELSQDLEFSKLYDMHVEWESSGLTSKNAMIEIKSGTSESINIQVFNYGNSDDAIKDYYLAISKCPQLRYEFQGVGDLPLPISPATNSDDGLSFGTLEITASSNHPSKECEIELSVYSEATGLSSYATLSAEVEAAAQKGGDTGESNEGSEDTESPNLESESTSLPAISSILCILMVLISALYRRK